MSNKTNSQYQQNIDIIKNFFKRPIVLVVGILTIVASVANSVISYIAEYNFNDILNGFIGEYGNGFLNTVGDTVGIGVQTSTPTAFSLDFFAIALGIALILLFAFGRSKSNNIQGGVTFFKVMAHIYYVAYFIVAICAVIMVIFTFAFSVDNLTKLILIVSFLAIGIFTFLLGYSQLQFAKSIKESMNTIYLSNSGAKLHSVLRIIDAVVMSTVATIVFCLILSWGGFNPMWIGAYSVVPVVFMISNEILWAIFALKYHRYINGITSGKIEIPVVTYKEEKEMICNNCGSPITDEDVFCSVCGNKVV